MTAWQEKKQGIIRMYEGTDASYSEIGAEFGVKRNTVAGVINRAGVKRRGGECRAAISFEVKSEIVELHNAGWKQAAVAQALGVSIATVTRVVKDPVLQAYSRIFEDA